MGFSLLQIIYWIALATWFGGVLFIAIAAPIIFRTIKESNPILPTVLSVNLEGQHGSLLAGTIVSNLISHLRWIELICGGGLLLSLIGQWFLTDTGGDKWLMPLVRSAMFIAALGFLVFDWVIIWPKLTLFRDQYIAHADEPDVANPANDEFNRYQRESELLLKIRLALLLGMVLFSTNIAPRPRELQAARASSNGVLVRSEKREAGNVKDEQEKTDLTTSALSLPTSRFLVRSEKREARSVKGEQENTDLTTLALSLPTSRFPLLTSRFSLLTSRYLSHA